MQIPLDLYRILGVPVQASLEQIQQAFEDRLQQLPRQQYSSAAIASRKQLLEEAYVELADPEKRERYDAHLLDEPLGEAEAREDSLMTHIDWADRRMAGAFLLFQEIGEYSLILEIGQQYLERSIDLAQTPTRHGASEDDVILSMALAHLELGREKWQQSEFEQAAQSLNSGLALLEQEQRFPDIQEEIRSDLYKLRPYRILELLNQETTEQREQGLALLKTMLNDRDGIDGNQDDRSGLSVNEFLRFVQQLREYMTVEEQQALFEAEAERPSAVASYLAVYALIARGVSEEEPHLIQRAKVLLAQLSDRQDIAVETGMCHLLLGQTEEAHQSVLMSQDEESMEFMQRYSEGAIDLIPGLYLYTENWLQKEVYPYFQNLRDESVSLQAYFDSPHIQAELTKLELLQRDTGAVAAPAPVGAAIADEPTRASGVHRTTTSAGQVLDADDLDWSVEDSALSSLLADNQPEPADIKTEAAPPPNPVAHRNGRAQPKSKRSRSPVSGLLPWAIAALLGVSVVGVSLALGRVFKGPQQVQINSDDQPTPDVVPAESPIVSPQAQSSAPPNPAIASPAAGTLTEEKAKTLIESWQTIKAKAMGQDYDQSQLTEVLAKPELDKWQYSSNLVKDRQGYWQYSLTQLDIEAVDQVDDQQSTVKALVKESAEYYENGQLLPGESYTDSYRVQYQMVRQGEQWLIKGMKVLS